ncbi:unnamed protein product, partial [Meganyctiphanes norvegica]
VVTLIMMQNLVLMLTTVLIILIQPVYGLNTPSLIQDALEPANPEILKYLAFLSDPEKLSNFDSVIRRQRQVIFKSSYQDLPWNLRSDIYSDEGHSRSSVSEELSYFIHVEVDEPPEPKSLTQLPKLYSTYFPPQPTQTIVTATQTTQDSVSIQIPEDISIVFTNVNSSVNNNSLVDNEQNNKSAAIADNHTGSTHGLILSNINSSMHNTTLVDNNHNKITVLISDNTMGSTQGLFEEEEVLKASPSNIEITSARLQQDLISDMQTLMADKLKEKQLQKNHSSANGSSERKIIIKPFLPLKTPMPTSFISLSLPSSSPTSPSSSLSFNNVNKSKLLRSTIPTFKPGIVTSSGTTQKLFSNSLKKSRHISRNRVTKTDGKINSKSSIGRSKIFALNFSPGEPGIDYPTYESIPPTGFDCSDKLFKGYFADEEAGCQVFHVCWGSRQRASFLCPVGTLFSQRFLVCDWWRRVDCSRTLEFQKTETTPFGAMLRLG